MILVKANRWGDNKMYGSVVLGYYDPVIGANIAY